MNRAIVIIILFIPLITLNSQNYEEEFKKYKEQTDSEYGEFKSKIITEYKDYLNAIDTEFSDFLKENWQEFNLYAGLPPPERPKPAELPKYSKSIQELSTQISFIHEHKISETPEPITPVPSEHKSEESLQLSLIFYGNELNIEYDNNFNKIILNEVNELKISECWDKLNQLNYGHLISQLDNIKYQLNLNDWGYYLLIKQVMEKIALGENNTSVLYTWFIMNKSRYKVRLGYNNNQVFLLIPSNTIIYETTYYNFDGINYYIPGFKSTNIHTYNQDYPEAESTISLYIDKPLNFKINESVKNIDFKYLDKSYQFSFKYNQNIIDFYKDYPLTDLSVYFNSSLSALAKQSIQQNFKSVIEGMDEHEVVNLLLQFVQNSFEYKIDQEHLNKEKFYFPEEIFYYPFSDCEDRSIFFSSLIKELLNLDIVGLNFPDHIALGINLKDDIEGDYIEYNNSKYVICDPTYLNAPVGKLIDECKEQESEVIQIDNKQNRQLKKEKIWDAISKLGGKRGNNSRDIIFDEEGSFYITGYFKGIMKIGKYQLESINESNDVFIAKIDKDNNISWAKSLGGTGEDLSYCLTIDKNKDVYMFGQFENALAFENLLLESGEKLNGFVTKINSKGSPVWLQKIDIDTSNSNNYFLTKFNSESEQEWINYCQNYKSINNFNIQINETGQLFITGLIPYLKNSSTLRMDSIFYATYNEFDIINLLIEEHKKLIQNEYEKTIAAIFAAINIVTNKYVILNGSIIQQAFEKSNPAFKNQNKEVFENLGYIKTIMKFPGEKIFIQTENGKTIHFNKIEIKDQALFSITKLNNGNARIDIDDGVKIGGESLEWSVINYTNLIKREGSIHIDYGNNYKTSMRMKPDIIN